MSPGDVVYHKLTGEPMLLLKHDYTDSTWYVRLSDYSRQWFDAKELSTSPPTHRVQSEETPKRKIQL